MSRLMPSPDSPNTLMGLVKSSWTSCPSLSVMLSFCTCSTIAWASSVRFPLESGRIMSCRITDKVSALDLRNSRISTSASANSGGTSIRSITSPIFPSISGLATTTTDLVRLSGLASSGSPGRTSFNSLKKSSRCVMASSGLALRKAKKRISTCGAPITSSSLTSNSMNSKSNGSARTMTERVRRSGTTTIFGGWGTFLVFPSSTTVFSGRAYISSNALAKPSGSASFNVYRLNSASLSMIVIVKSSMSREIRSSSLALPEAKIALIFSSTAIYTTSSFSVTTFSWFCSGLSRGSACGSASGSSSTNRMSTPDKFA